jgi:F0F1-type ATP synthase assembly protein I
MGKIVRTIFAAIAGIVIGIFVIELFQTLQAHFYPSAHLFPTHAERMKEIKEASWGAQLILLAGFTVGAFFGGYTGSRIAPSQYKMVAAGVVGFLFLLGCLVLFISLPYAVWLSISATAGTIVGAMLGYLAARK